MCCGPCCEPPAASRTTIGHLHAHGLSTRSCDIEEARAIDEVFGRPAQPLPVVAAKSYFGNLGAGSGMVELIASLLAMQARPSFPDAQLRDARSGVSAPRRRRRRRRGRQEFRQRERHAAGPGQRRVDSAILVLQR